MAKGFLAFKNNLKSIIDELVSQDDTQPFSEAHGHAEAEFEQWPAVVVHQLENGNENHQFQTNQTLLTMPYVIRAFWKADNTEETENNKLDALDKTLAKLRSAANYGNLGGAVDRFDILSVDPIAVESEEPLTGWQIIVSGAVRYTVQ